MPKEVVITIAAAVGLGVLKVLGELVLSAVAEAAFPSFYRYWNSPRGEARRMAVLSGFGFAVAAALALAGATDRSHATGFFVFAALVAVFAVMGSLVWARMSRDLRYGP